MLQISTVSGNVFSDKKFESLYKTGYEKLRISRTDLEKNRLRRKTDKGTDIGLILEQGCHLHDGDVLVQDGKHIVIEQIPEKIITVKPKESRNDFETLVLLGHVVGNRHRPISIQDNSVSFPIQSETEKETFEKLFAGIIDSIDLSIEEKIFKPHGGANVHEHG